MSQIAIPNSLTPDEIKREQTFGGSIDLCVKVAGLAPKQIQDSCGWDKGQYSRWIEGQEGIKWEKLATLMDTCGNDAPLLWMLNRRGYDLSSLRRRESEIERKLRLAEEEIERMKAERMTERRLISELMATRGT